MRSSNKQPDVRCWHKADMQGLPINVRYRGEADMAIALRNVCL